jgi:Uma2 family endonuclease
MTDTTMADRARRLMTVDEFLTWDDGTDTRYELVDGVIRAMAPPSNAHGTIVINIGTLLRTVLRDRRPCRPQAEAGIRIGDWTRWQADVAVTCTPITTGSEIDQPLLIVEVLSPGTRSHDLGRKLDDYKTLPSVREIWMVDCERRWVQVWLRNGDRWAAQDLVGSTRFDSGALDAAVALDDLYADSGL